MMTWSIKKMIFIGRKSIMLSITLRENVRNHSYMLREAATDYSRCTINRQFSPGQQNNETISYGKQKQAFEATPISSPFLASKHHHKELSTRNHSEIGHKESQLYTHRIQQF
ncbi:hypothetical protein Dimus_004483 [Dionaea muscipula]